MTCHLAILLAAVPVLAIAQSPPSAAAPPAADQAVVSDQPAAAAGKLAESPKPQLKKLGESAYQIGGVTINAQTREIRFPVKVNMDKGLQEYIICKQQGKLHEALLVTAINATHLSLAFTLLRYVPSPELFGLRDETGHPNGLYPKVPVPVQAGARIAVEVEWTLDDKTHRVPINDWLQLSVKETGMKQGPWLYTGAEFYDGKFIPEMSGDLAAIMVDQGCMINYPGPDNVDNGSQIWYAYPQRVPPVGTPVTVIITPYTNTRPLPKP